MKKLLLHVITRNTKALLDQMLLVTEELANPQNDLNGRLAVLQFLAHHLTRLPENHPERQHLPGLCAALTDHDTLLQQAALQNQYRSALTLLLLYPEVNTEKLKAHQHQLDLHVYFSRLPLAELPADVISQKIQQEAHLTPQQAALALHLPGLDAGALKCCFQALINTDHPQLSNWIRQHRIATYPAEVLQQLMTLNTLNLATPAMLTLRKQRPTVGTQRTAPPTEAKPHTERA